MDVESWIILGLIIAIESIVLQIYLPFPTGLILSMLGGFLIIGIAYKLEKYLFRN